MLVWFSTSTSLAQIIANFEVVDAVCENGKGTITCVSITGGTAPYTCFINCGSCVNVGTQWLNVDPGNYIATITDANGLQDTQSVTVGHDFPEPITLSVTTNPSACNGSTGSACAIATGGSGSFTYSWSSVAQPNVILSTTNCLNNVPAGMYRVIADDSNSPCSELVSFEILQTSLTLSSTVTNTQCAGADCQGNVLCTGSMTLVPAGTAPYTIVWSDGFVGNGLTRTGMCPGTYTATVTDANGCSASVTNTIAITGAQLLPNAMPPGANITNLNAVAGFATAAASTHFITTNTVWNNNTFGPNVTEITAACNIVVMPGVQLTIQGLNLRMPQGSSIRVLPQGMLGANNSVFEPGCGTTWRGFEVLGNGATASGQRGALELMECTITRATIGIGNGRFLNTGEITAAQVWQNPGGKVRAEKTLFLNNIVDVRLGDMALDAPTGNTGEFVSCTFLLETLPPICENVAYKWYLPTTGRVILGRCQYTIFNNCNFVNQNVPVFMTNPETQGTSEFVGLRSLSSNFLITGDPATTAEGYVSSFQGFRNGIWVHQSYAPGFPVLQSSPIEIQHTRFRCFTGMNINALGTLIRVQRNWLGDLPAPFSHIPPHPSPNTRVMLLLANFILEDAEYVIENNVFIDAQSEFNAVGCRIQHGGGNNNYIIANYFEGFEGSPALPQIGERVNAIHFSGRNRFGTTGGGAHFECNIFNSNRWDVWSNWASVADWSQTGPASIQGATWPSGTLSIPIVSAGNDFENSISSGSMDDFRLPQPGDFGSSPFYGLGINNYYYHPIELNANGTTELSPIQSQPTPVFLNQCEYRDEHIENLNIQELGPLVNQWTEQSQHYNSLVDEGNTAAIVNEITTLIPALSWDMYTALIDKVDVLSDKVLISLVHQLSFPTILLIDLLAITPGASSNARLHEELMDSGRLVSEADWNAIKNALPITTEKLSLEREMAATKLRYDVAVLQMENAAYASLTENLKNGISEDWKLPLQSMAACAHLWAQGQQPPAHLLDQVATEMAQFGLYDEWVEYQELQQLRLSVFARAPRVFTESEEEFLENYFYSDPLGKGYAAYALLNEFISFVPDPSVWESASNQTRSKKEPKVSADIEAAFAFPNPCENYTALRHESLEVYNAVFCIRNITGIPMMQGELKKGNRTHVLNLNELPTGVYLIELTLDNPRGTKYQQKLIKQ